MPLPHIKRLCSSHKQNGDPCTNPAMDNGVCKTHNGRAKRGVAHPNYKHGHYSKYMPTNLAQHVQEQLQNTSYLELHEDIAVTNARLMQLFEKLHTHESRQAVEDAIKHIAIYIGRHPDQDNKPLEHATQLLQGILGDYHVWQDIQQTQEHKRRLTDTERKRLEAANGTLRKQEALALLQGIILDTLETVSSERERQILIMKLQERYNG